MHEILAITGITGKSGQAFAYYLEKHQDVIRQMFPGGVRLLLHHERERDSEILTCFDVERCYGDLEDELFLSEALLGVDTIVHIAGIHWSRQLTTAAAGNFVRRMIMVHTTGIYSKYKEAGEEYRNIDDFVYMMCIIEVSFNCRDGFRDRTVTALFLQTFQAGKNAHSEDGLFFLYGLDVLILLFLFDMKCFFGTFFKVAKAEGVSEGGPSRK